MKTSFLTIFVAALSVSAAAIAAPNDARNGTPANSGTSIDIMMDSNATAKGAPKNEGRQPIVSTEKAKAKVKKKKKQALKTPPELQTPAEVIGQQSAR